MLLFCSTPDCETVLNKRDANKRKLECSKCNKSTCSDCKGKYHGSTNCEDNSAQHVYKWVAGISINNCPKCEALIEKNGGCPHMTCSNCNHYYCWSCGYQDGHFFHILGDYGGILCELFNEIATSKMHPSL